MIKKIFRNKPREFGNETNISMPSSKGPEITSDENEFKVEYKKIMFEGYYYFLPKYAMHRPVVLSMLNGNFAEPKTHKLVELLCSEQKGSIIHAGTFFGDMLPDFSKFVDGTVYAFEPVLENYVLAKLTVEENDLFNVKLFNSALSLEVDNLRIRTMQADQQHAGGSSNISEQGQICTSLKIDSLNAKDILLIQLDVEGHELMALKGALETIKLCRPVIAIEDHAKNCDAFLKEQQYYFAMDIPELGIWLPKEKREIYDLLKLI